MKKGKAWVGALMAIISIIAVATGIILGILDRADQIDKKNGPEEVSPDPIDTLVVDTIPQSSPDLPE